MSNKLLLFYDLACILIIITKSYLHTLHTLSGWKDKAEDGSQQCYARQ